MSQRERARLDHDYRLHKASQIGKVVQTLIWATAVVIMFWMAMEAFEASVGQTTLVDVRGELHAGVVMEGFEELGEWKNWAWPVLAVGLAGWALLERGLRRLKVPYLTKRVQLLEEQLDPNRTSSGLNPTGTTRKEDRGL